METDIAKYFTDYNPTLMQAKFETFCKMAPMIGNDLNPARIKAWHEYCDARDGLIPGTYEKLDEFFKYRNKKNRYYIS